MDVRSWRRRFVSERGHAGSTLSGLAAVIATIVTAVAIGGGWTALEIAGVILFGLALLGATQVPHLWLRKVYRRLDRITDESDPDRHEEFRIEV
ncbi:MAG: hypothetical protein IVW36_05790 [Dehalococcoidia bacterium]|nr:hypothetical protein [Dehalococcoidia bacterium]